MRIQWTLVPPFPGKTTVRRPPGHRVPPDTHAPQIFHRVPEKRWSTDPERGFCMAIDGSRHPPPEPAAAAIQLYPTRWKEDGPFQNDAGFCAFVITQLTKVFRGSNNFMECPRPGTRGSNPHPLCLQDQW